MPSCSSYEINKLKKTTMAHFQTIELDAIQVTTKRRNKINNTLTHLRLHGKRKRLELLQEGVLNSKRLRNWWQFQSSVDHWEPRTSPLQTPCQKKIVKQLRWNQRTSCLVRVMFVLNWLKYTFMLHAMFDHPVAICCNMLVDVGSNLKMVKFFAQHFGCYIMLYSFGLVLATLLH